MKQQKMHTDGKKDFFIYFIMDYLNNQTTKL